MSKRMDEFFSSSQLMKLSNRNRAQTSVDKTGGGGRLAFCLPSILLILKAGEGKPNQTNPNNNNKTQPTGISYK